MTYNNPQHNTNKYSCTPFPILKEGDTSGGIVTYLDLVDLGSISGFGVNLTEIGGTQRWDNTIITSWQTLFDAINEHLTIFNARLQELEQSANPDAITIISKSDNQLEANVNNVTWSSSSPQIIVNPTIGQTTTYSLASSATSYGSFTLTANRELIEEGESITITAQWTGKTTTYDAIITATKSGMTPATKSVQLPKEAICPTSVTLDNGKTITLNSSGYGTLTYTPSVGSYTIRTQGNETPGSCSFTVAAAQPTTTYYWYVGTTLPTAANLLSIATGSATSKPNWSTPYSIAATNNTGESSYMYYCFPAEWNVIVLDSDRSTEVALASEGTITVNNITYSIQRTGRKISNGTSKDYYAIFNNVDAITITSKSNNQLEANVDNVSWSSDSSYIDVDPTSGKTTTYSLTDSATSYGSFELTASESSIEEGESITITAQWTGNTTPYSATITATKSGMRSATKQVTLSKEATCPAYVDLDNGARITLDSNGRGTYTYTPAVGNYTVTTQGNETQGSCSFTVVEATPKTITITSKSGNQLEANVDNVSWSSDYSYFDVNPKTGKTTTYSLNITPYGSFELTASESSIEEGESITITAQWTGHSRRYSSTITASKSGMISARKTVQLSIEETCPAYVDLDNGARITLDSNGRGTYTYTPAVGNYTVTTQGNETQGSCSFTVVEATPKTITITSKSGNQLEANVDNVNWSSNNSYFDVNPKTGKTTTYSLTDSATSYGSFELTASESSIEEGESITITAQWTGKTTTYRGPITATKSGMTSATKSVTLSKEATCPAYVYLNNGTTRIPLDTNSGRGTYTYTPAVGNYTIRTHGNETQGSCSFTVVEATPKTITITSKSGNQLEANVDNVSWSSDSSYIDVDPTSGKTTTYSLTDSATSYGSFVLNVDSELIEEGESITITAQWYEYTTPYSATITATKSGMRSATKQVTLSKEAVCPSYVYLDNGARITLNSSGRGTYTYTPTVGSYTVKTQGNEVQGSCSFTVNEVTPVIEPVNADLIAQYNIQSTSSPTTIYNDGSSFKAMEIDGVVQPNIVSSYQFNTTGQHTIKYELNGSRIGDGAFEDCSRLTSIDILDSVTSIGTNTFDSCSSLTSCTIGDNVTSIADNAFYNCTDLTSVTIGNSVTSIGTNTFDSCSSLTSIDIPNSVTSIGDGAFYNCSNLTSVTLSNNLTEISDGVFSDCSSLTSIDIPDSVTSIGRDVFYCCSSLTSIDIPDSVTSIGDFAFYYCSNLTSVTSNAMTAPTISNDTFRNVKTGGTLYVPSGSSGYDVWMGTSDYYLGKYSWNIDDGTPDVEPIEEDIVAYYNIQDTSSPTTICNNSSNIKSMEIDGVVQSSVVRSYQFNTTGQHTIKYELNDSSIGDGTFASTSLTSINISNDITSIYTGAFSNCSGLTSVDIPDSVTYIGGGAFNGCSGLVSCTIGNSVTNIGNGAFSGCNKLTSITSNAMTAPTISNTTFQGVKSRGTLYVPSGSSGYDVWMGTSDYYLGYSSWTKIEQ